MKPRFLSWIFLAWSAVASAEAPQYITFPSDIDWVTRETAHFHILYRRGEDRLAERTLAAAERAHRLLAPIFPETPTTTWIVLSDFHDSLNGYAIDYPFPHFVIFANPPEPTSQLAALDNWLDSVVLHEYVHVLHLYPAHGMWSALRTVFGSWVLPNGLLPSHLHEGLATFFETEFSRGGRGRGTTFSMFTRMAVKEGLWGKDFVPLDLLEGSIRWPQGASPYYFGYQLYADLWKRRGPDGIREFVLTTSGTILPYWLSRTTNKVYQENYPTLWATIFQQTGEKEQAEIASIEQRPLSHLKYLTQSRYSKWDLVLSVDGKTLAYRKSHPDTGSTLEWFPVGEPEKGQSFDLEAGHQEGMCWILDQGKNYLVFAETEYDNNYQYNVLRIFDPEKKIKYSPREDGNPIRHVQAIGCGGGEVLLYLEVSGHGKVVQWGWGTDLEKFEKKREWEVPEGGWVTSILPGKPNRMAVRRAVSTEFYSWGSGDPIRETEVHGHFYRLGAALPSGEFPAIAGVSGREEVWGIDLKRKWARKLVAVVGGVNAYDYRGDRWWVSSYRHGGYDIAESTLVKDAGRSLETEPAARENAQAIAASDAKSYNPLSTLYPRAWIPSMLIVPNGAQFSAWIPGFDVSQKHFYNLLGGYDTRGSPFLIGDYSYRFGPSHQLNFDINYLPTYLIASKAFLRQWGTSVGWSSRLSTKLPWVSLTALFKRVESSALGPAVQSVGLAVGLSDTFWMKTAPRAIAPLRATKVGLNFSRYFQVLGGKDNFYSFTASLDQYLQAPWAQRHVFKFGARIGLTEGTVLYNSFFQGGGELAFSPGRGFFLNRGFLPGTFLNQKMITFNLDYLFPLFEVERGYDQWPFFLKRVDAALTADTTSMGRFMYYYSSVGFELKSYWKTFFYFPTVIRAGAYHGFGPYGEPIYITTAIEATL